MCFLARRPKSGTKSREQMFVGTTGCDQGTQEIVDPLLEYLYYYSNNYSKYTIYV